jgi:transposase
MATVIGIDVHKTTLEIAEHGGRQWQRARTDAGMTRLVEELRGRRPDRIVLEPSGRYDRRVIETLQAADLPVARVHATRVRHFAKAHNIQAKADRLDARLLALFGATMQPRGLVPLPPAVTQVRDLTTRRRQLTDMIADERRRLEEAPPVSAASIQRLLGLLAAERDALDHHIAALVAAEPVWQRRRAILLSVPGIGAQTATPLLAALPELGQLDGKAIAALVGVAPITHQSGATPGHARIQGGREAVRTGLWMPTLTARRCNPGIRAFAARLTAAGKPAKVVTTACLRKLLTLLNTLLAKDQCWDPARVAA